MSTAMPESAPTITISTQSRKPVPRARRRCRRRSHPQSELLLRAASGAEGHQPAALRQEVTAFIGPSGCGKSTLLRVLNRIYDLYPEQRATGEVLLDGQNILSPKQDLNLLRARIGMVFQKPTPFPMSIYDNIAFGVRLYEKLSGAEMDARVEAALRRAALWDEVKDKLKQSGLSLSGGQQQRLCIARGDRGQAGGPAAGRALLGARSPSRPPRSRS